MQLLAKERAEAIGIAGLQHLAGEDDLLMRFCYVTGILPNDIRDAATQPHFLVGVLDFFLSHEPDLLAFAEAANIKPELVMGARYSLAPEDMAGLE